MPMTKGFWKKVDPTKLQGSEKTAYHEYTKMVESKNVTVEQREAARAALINALLPRFTKNRLIPPGQELTVMYNRRNFFVGFKDIQDKSFFDLGNP